MTFLVKTVAVFKFRVVHAEKLCLLVHLRNKGFLGAAHRLRKRNGSVVCRDDNDRLYKVVDRHLFTFNEPDIRAVLRRRHRRGRDDIIIRELSRFDRLKYEAKRHDLCYRGAGAALVGVFLIERFSCGKVHKQSRGSGKPHFVRYRFV